MFKFVLALLLLAMAVALEISSSDSIPANSDLGQSLLSKARPVAESSHYRQLENDDDGYYNMAWMVDYSLVFQGCYSIKQWNYNNDGDGNDDDGGGGGDKVWMITKSLVRFRLCPKKSCSFFCVSGYGDYIVDLATFVEAYVESKRRQQEYECQTYLYNNCDCDDGDDRDDGFNADYCEYNCFKNGKKSQCIDRDPYDEEGESGEEDDIGRYMECNEFEMPDDDGYNNNRNLNQDDDGAQYYVGPYCGAQGGKIFVGMFTDDTCTNFADSSNGRSTYKTLTGQQLPYATKSVVDTDCIPCLAQEDPNREDEDEDNNNNNNNGNQEELAEVCERAYEPAGKCEKNIKSGVVPYPSNNGCGFISGVKIAREDGLIIRTRRSPVATFFIVMFAAMFACLCLYVWYLRKRLGFNYNKVL